MNIGEASAVNVVATYLIEAGAPLPDEALQALGSLVDRANRALAAGVAPLDLVVLRVPTTGEDLLSAARQASQRALKELDRAVTVRLSELVLDLYPTAAVLHAVGEYNEDGLLHLHTDRIVDADGQVLADYGDHQTSEFDELTDQVDALLDELAERDEAYQGAQEFELRTESDG